MLLPLIAAIFLVLQALQLNCTLLPLLYLHPFLQTLSFPFSCRGFQSASGRSIIFFKQDWQVFQVFNHAVLQVASTLRGSTSIPLHYSINDGLCFPSAEVSLERSLDKTMSNPAPFAREICTAKEICSDVMELEHLIH